MAKRHGVTKILFKTGWLAQQKFTFSQFWRLKSPRSRCQAPFQFIAGAFLLCPHMVEWARELCYLFLRALILAMRAPAHDLVTFQRPHLLTSPY